MLGIPTMDLKVHNYHLQETENLSESMFYRLMDKYYKAKGAGFSFSVGLYFIVDLYLGISKKTPCQDCIPQFTVLVSRELPFSGG